MCQTPQGTSEHDAVETREGPLNLRFEFSDKLFQGVSTGCMVIWNIIQRTSWNAILSLRLAAMRGEQFCLQLPLSRPWPLQEKQTDPRVTLRFVKYASLPGPIQSAIAQARSPV
jgi:hypothetical protein